MYCQILCETKLRQQNFLLHAGKKRGAIARGKTAFDSSVVVVQDARVPANGNRDETNTEGQRKRGSIRMPNRSRAINCNLQDSTVPPFLLAVHAVKEYSNEGF